MTVASERAQIALQLDNAFAEATAIVERVKLIQTWTERRNRPLHVHREIKRIMKATGDPIEMRVALNFIQAEVAPLIQEHKTVGQLAIQYERELLQLTSAENSQVH